MTEKETERETGRGLTQYKIGKQKTVHSVLSRSAYVFFTFDTHIVGYEFQK